ncbi:hypothetical protein ACO0SA_000921 [Hanseniaspora valbyensis]
MSLRNLSEVERIFALETFQCKRNGIISASVYTCKEEEDMLKDETATLSTIKSVRVAGGEKCSLIKQALTLLISENSALQVCINEELKFCVLDKINVKDVLTKLDFENLVDEKISCYHSLPLPMLKEIFNKFTFDFGKPLWRVYLVDENMIIFHGNECLFDDFSMMMLQSKMQDCIKRVRLQQDCDLNKDVEVLFKLDKNKDLNFPKSIYDSGKLFIPSIGREIFNSQAQFFFQKIYKDTIKKPLDFLTGSSMLSHAHDGHFLNKYNDLCGNSIFGNLTPEQYTKLKCFLDKENLTLKSFIATLTMISLDFDSSKNKEKCADNKDLIFQFPFNLRDKASNDKLETLNFKNITIKCPLKYATDKNFLEHDFYNGYDPKNIRFSIDDPDFKEKLMDFNFDQISQLIESQLNTRIKAWQKSGLNDDDFKRMKMMASKNFTLDKCIEINDLTDFKLEVPDKSSYLLKDLFFIKSANPQTFISISLTATEISGLNLAISYPEGYDLDDFVMNFETTLKLVCGN